VECVTGDMFAIGSLVKVPPEHNTLCMHMGTVVQPQVNIAQCAPTYHILSKLGQRGSGSHVHSTCVLRAGEKRGGVRLAHKGMLLRSICTKNSKQKWRSIG
jgi:hypothetical protein